MIMRYNFCSGHLLLAVVLVDRHCVGDPVRERESDYLHGTVIHACRNIVSVFTRIRNLLVLIYVCLFILISEFHISEIM